MTAIAVTAASVAPGDGTQETRLSGAAITAGQLVYMDANGLYQVATNATAASSVVRGVALDTAPGAGQPLTIQRTGKWTVGGTVVVGKSYNLGTAGGIIPVDDIAGGEYITNVGVGISATQIDMGAGPQNSSTVAAAAVT